MSEPVIFSSPALHKDRYDIFESLERQFSLRSRIDVYLDDFDRGGLEQECLSKLEKLLAHTQDKVYTLQVTEKQLIQFGQKLDVFYQHIMVYRKTLQRQLQENEHSEQGVLLRLYIGQIDEVLKKIQLFVKETEQFVLKHGYKKDDESEEQQSDKDTDLLVEQNSKPKRTLDYKNCCVLL